MPHDLRDEGVETVVNNLVEARMNALFVAVNYFGERHPSPAGTLPRNPHGAYHTQGGAYYPVDTQRYSGSIKPVQTPEPGFAGHDFLMEATQAAHRKGLKAYGWLHFSHRLEAMRYPESVIVSVTGEPVPEWGPFGSEIRRETWLCVNRPEVRIFVEEMVRDLMSRYDFDGLLIDFEAQPLYHGGAEKPEIGFTCFCNFCKASMQVDGIDVAKLTQELLDLIRDVRTVVTEADQGWSFPNSRQLLEWLTVRPAIVQWLAFRGRSLAHYAHCLRSLVKHAGREKSVILNLSDPTQAWTRGQAIALLAPHADAVKQMLYHRSAAKKLANEVRRLRPIFPASGDEEILSGCSTFLGIRGSFSLEQLEREGFTMAWIADEIRTLRRSIGNGIPAYAGLQLWGPVTPAEMQNAVTAALGAGANGVIAVHYGWGDLTVLHAVKQGIDQWMRETPCTGNS